LISTGTDLAGKLKALPGILSAMKTSGVGSAVSLVKGFGAVISVIGLIAQGIALVTSLFGGMGDEGVEELEGIEKVLEDVKALSEQWMDEFTDAIIEFAKTGELTFKEFINSVIEDMFRLTFQEFILSPVLGAITGHAKGDIVDGPTYFSSGGKSHVMGEAGPEAIVPLTRMGDGSLGIASAGGSKSNVNVNIHADGASQDNVSVTKNRRQDGGMDIDVFFLNGVKGAIRSGKVTKDLEQVLGQRRKVG